MEKAVVKQHNMKRLVMREKNIMSSIAVRSDGDALIDYYTVALTD